MHILGALPDRVDLGVAVLAGHRPVLHVAVAPEDLEALARRRDPLTAGPDLGERDEDAPQQRTAVSVPVLEVGEAAGAGALEHHRHAALQLGLHVDELLAHQRVGVDPVAELLAVGCVDGRLEERPAVDADPHHGDAPPAAVDHLHHPVETAPVSGGVARLGLVGPARQPRPGPVDLDLGRRHADRAHLRLQPLDVEVVVGAVGQHPGHDERGEPSTAFGGTLGAGQHDEHLGVGVGAEVLLAVDAPVVAVLDGSGRVGAHVASALTLGEEHAALPRLVGVEAVEAGEQVLAGLVGSQALDHVGGAGAHAESAVDGDLGLRHEVRARCGDDARHVSARVGRERHEARADEIGLGLEPRRVVDDLVDLATPFVVAAELRPVLVGDLGPGRDPRADQLAVLGDVFLRELAVVGIGQIAVELEPQVGVDLVPVEPDGGVEFSVIGEHGTTVPVLPAPPSAPLRTVAVTNT